MKDRKKIQYLTLETLALKIFSKEKEPDDVLQLIAFHHFKTSGPVYQICDLSLSLSLSLIIRLGVPIFFLAT